MSHMAHSCAHQRGQPAGSVVYYSAKNLIHVDIWFFHRSANSTRFRDVGVFDVPSTVVWPLACCRYNGLRCRAEEQLGLALRLVRPGLADAYIKGVFGGSAAGKAASTRSNGASALGGSVSSTVSWVRPKSRRRR